MSAESPGDGASVETSAPARTPLPRAVIALGWVSLLTDAASDMIYPLVPAFLLSIGGGAEALGWLEGIAEAVAAVLKLVAGKASDRPGPRKPLVAAGYAISAISRPLFAIATLPIHAVLIRALDRVGKGVRGPPRDAILAAAVGPEGRGAAFGFHRMMDNFGGVVGPIVAFALIRVLELRLQQVFALAAIPGLLSVLVILLFVREPPRAAPKPAATRAAASTPAATFPPAARRYFAALLVFSLAGSADLFLMRRLIDLHLDVALIPIAWISLQLGKALLNVPGGRASDRWGRRHVLAIAWLVYAASYAGFALVTGWIGAWLMLGVYAFHYGLAEGGQRALLAEFVPEEARGRAFGVQLAIEGAMVLPANVLFGMIYARAGAQPAFLAAAAIALAGAVLLALTPWPPLPQSGGGDEKEC